MRFLTGRGGMMKNTILISAAGLLYNFHWQFFVVVVVFFRLERRFCGCVCVCVCACVRACVRARARVCAPIASVWFSVTVCSSRLRSAFYHCQRLSCYVFCSVAMWSSQELNVWLRLLTVTERIQTSCRWRFRPKMVAIGKQMSIYWPRTWWDRASFVLNKN